MYKKSIILFLWTYSVLAQAALPLKNDVASVHWIPLSLVLLILLIVLLLLIKYSQQPNLKNPKTYILETIPIHYKTKAYIIEYQGQRFLITDNQNAIAIHAFNN